MKAIKMRSILANPHVTAGENEVVEISRLHPDPKKATKIAAALVEAGFADDYRGKLAAKPAEAGDDDNGDGEEKAFLAKLPDAIAKLDPSNDDHWTKDGKPSMSALEEMVGDKRLSRADVEAAFPDFRRPDDEGEDGDGEWKDDDGGEGAAAKAAGGKPGAGPRSNKP